LAASETQAKRKKRRKQGRKKGSKRKEIIPGRNTVKRARERVTENGRRRIDRKYLEVSTKEREMKWFWRTNITS
jgi:hypothetical protein